jgi:hypothetical protein
VAVLYHGGRGAAGNTNTALPGFLETARQIAGQTIPARLVPGHLPG